MGSKTRSGLRPRPGPQRRAKGKAKQDPEYWQPRDEFAPGRPRVYVKRTMETHPPPTPQDTDCVLWCGAVDRYGYGVMSANNRRVRAHRWMYEMHNSPILPGLVVRHKCDNRACVNLDHLELGTQAENVRDAALRNHLGPVRSMTPSQVLAVAARKATGEPWSSIGKDFPEFSLPTIRRAVRYAAELAEG